MMNLCPNLLKSPLAAVAVASLLAACGGGGGGADAPADPPPVTRSTPPPAATPPVVTQAVAAEGGDVVVPLADGAHATLRFEPQTLAAPTTVTVTPQVPAAGEWTRFGIAPAPSSLQGPLTLRVRPAAGVEAGQLPVLQLLTADGPLPLRTRVLADGELQTTLSPALPGLGAGTRAAAATPGRMQALSASRALADGGGASGDGATVVGTGFLATCQGAPAVVADAMRVIDHASSARGVHVALTTLALVADRCVQPGALDEAALLRVNQALQDLAGRLPRLYADALAAWQARNYLVVETELVPFERGLRRLMALCAAARELEADLACPRDGDFAPEFEELGYGFVAASNEPQYAGRLRPLFDHLLTLPGEAALMGLPAAEAELRESVAYIADRLMDAAYAQCSHGELFEWRAYVDGGGHSRRSAQALARAIAHCGISGLAERVAVDDDGREQRSQPQAFEPGTLDGAGRTEARTLTLPFDGRAVIAVGGPSLRCSRVIGAPEQRETLQLRVGTTLVGQLPLDGVRDAVGTPRSEAALDVQRLLAQLGRDGDNAEPIVVEVWRVAAGPLACADSAGGTLALQTEDHRLFTLTLEPPVAAMRVRVAAPPAVAERAAVRIEVRARGADGVYRPLAGAALSVQATGGQASASAGLRTNAEGLALISVRPSPGHAAVELLVRAELDGVHGESAVRIPIGKVRWTGSFSYYYMVNATSSVDFDPGRIPSYGYAVQGEQSLAAPALTIEGNPWETGAAGLELPLAQLTQAEFTLEIDDKSQNVVPWTEECRWRLVHKTTRDFVPHAAGEFGALPALRISTPAIGLDGSLAYRLDLGGFHGTAVLTEVWTSFRSPQAGDHCTSESHMAPPRVYTFSGPERGLLVSGRTLGSWRLDLPAQPATDEIVVDIVEPPEVRDDGERRTLTGRTLRLRLRPQLP